MRKMRILICLGILISIFAALTPVRTYATSWVSLKPEEVEKKAQLVVSGKYEIGGNPKSNGTMWIPFTFRVDKYYKGSGPDTIQAAIETFDVNWSKDFQEQGGTFLLFLEKLSTKNDLWTPVAGPNGMVMVLNGKIQPMNTEDAPYYEKYLAEKQGSDPTGTAKAKRSGYGVSAAGLALVVLLVLVAAVLLARKRGKS